MHIAVLILYYFQIQNFLQMIPLSSKTEESLKNYGMEYVTAVAFHNEIEKSFGISIGETATFDYPNLSDLSDYVFELISTDDTKDIDTTMFSDVLFDEIPDDIEQLSLDDVAK